MVDLLVTGGTGTLGTSIVARLTAGGSRVRVQSHPSSARVPPGAKVVHGGLGSDEGIDEAVAGVEVVIHAARVTQFHSFTLRLLDSLTDADGTAVVPRDVSLQPVTVDEVAGGLVSMAGGAPANEVVLFGGPEVLSLEELAQSYQRHRGMPGAVRAGEVDNPTLAVWRSGAQLVPDHAEAHSPGSNFSIAASSARLDEDGTAPGLMATPSNSATRTPRPDGRPRRRTLTVEALSV